MNTHKKYTNKKNPYIGFLTCSQTEEMAKHLPKHLHSMVGILRHAPITTSFLLQSFYTPKKCDKSTQTDSEDDDWEILMHRSPTGSSIEGSLENKSPVQISNLPLK